MHDFVTLKQEEERIVDTQIREREDALGRIEAFTSKKEAIQSQIDSINAEPVARSANRLRTEANELDIQIRELENQLFEMKTRHRHLMDQGQQLENSVQSKLSSYNASLELIHKDVKQFLARPPIAQSSSGTTHSSNNGTGVAESFYSLNPKRRTLEMANEHWREEREALERRKKSIQHEKTALEEGGKIWREVVTEVQTFEQNLKTHMQHLSKGSISQQERDEGMAIVLDSMNKIIEDVLERRLQEAEEKDWKLLICCVGAELEAFREGREMLVQASGLRMRGTAGERKQGDGLLDDGEFPPTPPAATATGSKEEDFFTQQHQDPLQEDDSKGTSTFDYGTGSVILSPISTGDGGTVPSRALSGKPTSSADSRSSESEDDDPGPDFLISHS